MSFQAASTSCLCLKQNTNLSLIYFINSSCKKKSKYPLKSYKTKQTNKNKQKSTTKRTQFSISYRGHHIWNTILKHTPILKNLEIQNIFKHKIKKLVTFTADNINYIFEFGTFLLVPHQKNNNIKISSFLTHNREYCNAVSSVCLSSVTNNFYQFGLLDFYDIQVSKAYNFC